MKTKNYIYKVYNLGGDFLGALDTLKVVSKPSFSASIMEGCGEMIIEYKEPFDDYNSTLIYPMAVIETWAYTDDHINGIMIHKGVVSRIESSVESSTESVFLYVQGLAYLMTLDVFNNGSATLAPSSSLYANDLVESIMTPFDSIYDLITRPSGSVDVTGAVLQVRLENKTYLQSLEELAKKAKEGVWFAVMPDGVLKFQEKPTSPAHTLTIGKDVHMVNVALDSEEIINSVVYRYYPRFDSTGPEASAVTRTYEDASSVALYGRRRLALRTNLYRQTTAIDQEIEAIVNTHKDPVTSGSLTVNSEYDFESIRVGETVKVRNYKSGAPMLVDGMQIFGYTYTPEKMTLELGRHQNFGKNFKKKLERLNYWIAETY